MAVTAMASDVLHELQLWVAPMTGFAALYAAYLVYSRTHKAKEPTTPTQHQRRRRASRNEFKFAVSRLDTHGNLITSWQPGTPPDLASQDMLGWFNLAVVLVIAWIVQHLAASWKNGLAAWHAEIVTLFASVHIPELALAWFIEVAYFFLATHVYMQLVVRGVLRGPAEIAVQVVLEAIMLCAPLLWLRTCLAWPVTQRLALGMETTVLFMKMHSYITTNRHLCYDVENGGPGTGSSIWRLRNAVDDARRALAEAASHPPADAPAEEHAQHVKKANDAIADTMSQRGEESAHAGETPKPPLGSAPQPPSPPASDSSDGATTTIRQFHPPEMALHTGRRSGNFCHRLNSMLRRDTQLDSTEEPRSASSQTTGLQTAESNGAERQAVRMKPADAVKDAVIWSLNAEGQATATSVVTYPHNVHFRDLFGFACVPTLVYEPSYPRTHVIRVGYVIEKMAMAAGLLTAGHYIIQSSITPAVDSMLRDSPMDVVIRLIIPMTFLLLITFWVTFECVLNAVAELTLFGSRDFYGPWWCSSSFAEMSRLWNKPVHEALLRHVYLDARRHSCLSADTAMYLTFGVSILLHEVLLWSAFAPAHPPPYLAALSCLQFPLMRMLRTPWFRRTTLGNLVFWSGLIVGVTMSFYMYTRVYLLAVAKSGASAALA